MHVTVTDIQINRHAIALPEFGIDVEGRTADEIVARALNSIGGIPKAEFEFVVTWWEMPNSDAEPVARSAFGHVPVAGGMN